MPRVKDVLELVKRRYTHAKATPAAAGKKAAPLNGHKANPVHKRPSLSRVEITRAVFPNKG